MLFYVARWPTTLLVRQKCTPLNFTLSARHSTGGSYQRRRLTVRKRMQRCKYDENTYKREMQDATSLQQTGGGGAIPRCQMLSSTGAEGGYQLQMVKWTRNMAHWLRLSRAFVAVIQMLCAAIRCLLRLNSRLPCSNFWMEVGDVTWKVWRIWKPKQHCQLY